MVDCSRMGLFKIIVKIIFEESTDCSSVEDQELCRPDPDPTFGNVLTGSRSEFRKRFDRIQIRISETFWPDPHPNFGNILTGSRSDFRKRFDWIQIRLSETFWPDPDPNFGNVITGSHQFKCLTIAQLLKSSFESNSYSIWNKDKNGSGYGLYGFGSTIHTVNNF